ncbi:MAG: DNA/RNA non-specific endonuclease [Bacteroidales bacterium]|nr:DNA/RNA non-specific endonuclease [Bacteroidales bacterium]
MKRHISILLTLTLISAKSYAQDVEQVAAADPVAVSGGLTASGVYITPLDSASAQKEFTYYLSGSLNLTAFGVVSVPMSFAYTNNALTSTLTCPFNRFSISPSWRWIKTYMGYASMSFSPYTMSGREFMGGGVELTPPEMPWRFAAYYGRYYKSQAIDSVHTEAIYRRVGGGVKIGFEKERFRVAVNVNKAYDVASSLTFGERDTNYVAPKSNISGSVEAWKKLKDCSDPLRKKISLLEDISSWPQGWKFEKSGNGVVVKNSSGKELATVYEDKIVAQGRISKGEKGNELLNFEPLIRNTRYEVDGIEYYTDALGRVEHTKVDLGKHIDKIDKRAVETADTRLGNQQTRAVDIKDGDKGADQGGHIVAARFFGPGEQINLYPQSATLNQGAWKVMEDEWAKSLKDGKKVEIEIKAIFDGESKRPDGFQVDFWIDGVEYNRPFFNQ